MAVFSAWLALDAKAMQAGPSAWKSWASASRFVDDAGGVQGGRMGSTARVARCLQSIQHRLPHLRGLVQSGCGVVKVDHGLTTFPAFSIFSAMTYILVTPPTASFSVMP